MTTTKPHGSTPGVDQRRAVEGAQAELARLRRPDDKIVLVWNDADTLNRLAFWLGIGGTVALLLALGVSRLAKRVEDRTIAQLSSANTQLAHDLDASKTQVVALEAQTAELKQKALPRALTVEQRSKMLAELKKAGPHAVAVACHMFDLESCEYAKQIHAVFVQAGWTVAELIQNSTLNNESILLTSNIDPVRISAFAPARRALAVAGIKNEAAPLTGNFITPVYKDTLHVIVGPKPLS